MVNLHSKFAHKKPLKKHKSDHKHKYCMIKYLQYIEPKKSIHYFLYLAFLHFSIGFGF